MTYIKKILYIIYPIFFLNICVIAQENKTITIKAGTRVLDYFPVRERYRYPDFKDGELIFKNGLTSPARFNYNILLGEMEFLQSRDTLSIINKKDISHITVGKDTFFYDNGYIELIDRGAFRVGLKQYIRLKDIQRKGAYGMTDRNSSIDTYNSMSVTGKYYELVPNEDWVFQKSVEYYFSTPSGDFVQFNRKNIIKVFPQKKDVIKDYLRSNKTNFKSREDLLKLSEYLGDLG